MQGVTALDLIVLAVIAVSAVLAFIRGFVQEVLAVAGWVGAALATLYGFPYLQPFARARIDIALLADALTAVSIFLIVLIALSFLSHAIAVRVRGSGIGALDRSLGLLFGIARGAVIVIAAFLLVDWAVPAEDQPDWLKNARVTPLAGYAGAVIKDLVPGRLRDQGAAAASAVGERMGTAIGAPPPAAEADSGDRVGYKKMERQALEYLLRNAHSP